MFLFLGFLCQIFYRHWGSLRLLRIWFFIQICGFHSVIICWLLFQFAVFLTGIMFSKSFIVFACCLLLLLYITHRFWCKRKFNSISIDMRIYDIVSTFIFLTYLKSMNEKLTIKMWNKDERIHEWNGKIFSKWWYEQKSFHWALCAVKLAPVTVKVNFNRFSRKLFDKM